ncbi:MAG: type II toxin-antitoxin system HicB family antitoxin [Candidatus Infernicultor aquiphilus]|uniref:Type II toxin-antitoxin system HicB family antitoxin n=1 Tax=Candidatus Infernicultor aquiphilus TaxID=1805029 RepID=A0A2M7PPY6_9BACT|nr:MAG: type II toxin-antitoxin system HicB family antitoxin [Candidatus Atribacteria bacterium CG_4_10_14_3_um_filter_34_13]
MKTYRFSVVVEKDEEGYFAFCPELQGCYTQGDTYEEVLENIKDAIRLHVNDRLDSGEKIPQAQSVSLTSLELAV